MAPFGESGGEGVGGRGGSLGGGESMNTNMFMFVCLFVDCLFVFG